MRVKVKQRYVHPDSFELLSEETGVAAPRVVMRITLARGASLVRQGKAKPIYPFGSTVCVGFQIIGDRTSGVAVSKICPALQSQSVTFTKREVEALAGLHGESKTAAMRDDWKKKGCRFDPDRVDFVEAARLKQGVYKSVR